VSRGFDLGRATCCRALADRIRRNSDGLWRRANNARTETEGCIEARRVTWRQEPGWTHRPARPGFLPTFGGHARRPPVTRPASPITLLSTTRSGWKPAAEESRKPGLEDMTLLTFKTESVEVLDKLMFRTSRVSRGHSPRLLATSTMLLHYGATWMDSSRNTALSARIAVGLWPFSKRSGPMSKRRRRSSLKA
jgi:hypothetical protein